MRRRPHPAPAEPEWRPPAEPFRGPATAAEMLEQLAADPEYLEWRSAERLAELFGHVRISHSRADIT